MQKNGAIIILSGGLTKDGKLPSFVKNRIVKALEHKTDSDFIITATRTTVYKAPPRDKNGYPLDDAVIYAKVLVKKGIKREDVRIENCSLETLGSAYFLRVLHVDPLKIRTLKIITSSFHMPRVKCAFGWVFSLPIDKSQKQFSRNISIRYIETKNIGIAGTDLIKRIAKENQGIEKINLLKNKIHTLDEFNQWLFRDHAAYSAGLPLYKISRAIKKTY
jgi:hypothetical protein